MKILLVSNGYPPDAVGGVEVYTQELANGLARKGHSVAVFCRQSDLSIPDYRVIDRYESAVRVIRLVNDYKTATSYRHTFLDINIERYFEKLLREVTPNLVHVNHLIALSAQLPKIIAEYQIPQVLTLHDFWPLCQRVNLIDWQGKACLGPRFLSPHSLNCTACITGSPEKQAIANSLNWAVKLVKRATTPKFRKRLRQLLPGANRQLAPLMASDEIFRERRDIFKQTISLADRLLAPSNFVRAQYIANGYSADKVSVVPLGVSIENLSHQEKSQPNTKLAPRPKSILRFAAIGTITPIKGLDLLIRAFKQIPHKNLRLDIYGRDATFSNYSQALRKLAKGDRRITFQGDFLPSARAEIYQRIDILVVPSTVPESFSLVSREALFSGKPVIAANAGALPEIIADGVNGFLFKPGDETALSEILEKIAGQPEILHSLQCPGPAPILQFEQHLDTIERVYAEVMRRPGDARDRGSNPQFG